MTSDKVTESHVSIYYPITGDLWVDHLKFLMHFSPPILSTCTALFIFLSFNAIIVWESTNPDALHYTLSSSLLFFPTYWFQIFRLSTLFSDTLSQCSLQTLRDHVSDTLSQRSLLILRHHVSDTLSQHSLLTLRDHISDTLSQRSLLTLRDHVSDTLSQCSLLTLIDQISDTHKTKGKITVLYITVIIFFDRRWDKKNRFWAKS